MKYFLDIKYRIILIFFQNFSTFRKFHGTRVLLFYHINQTNLPNNCPVKHRAFQLYHTQQQQQHEAHAGATDRYRFDRAHFCTLISSPSRSAPRRCCGRREGVINRVTRWRHHPNARGCLSPPLYARALFLHYSSLPRW